MHTYRPFCIYYQNKTLTAQVGGTGRCQGANRRYIYGGMRCSNWKGNHLNIIPLGNWQRRKVVIDARRESSSGVARNTAVNWERTDQVRCDDGMQRRMSSSSSTVHIEQHL